MSTETAIGTVTVTHYDTNGTWLIALEGDHDMSTTPLLEQQTSGVWRDCNLAVVDLGEVTFIDCSTINWLLRTRGALGRHGHEDVLRIVQGPSGGAARRMFDLLRPHDVFACYPTRQDALALTAAIPESSDDSDGSTRAQGQPGGSTLS